MIEWIRKYVNSWVVRLFFLLLAICFAFLWGGQDALRMMGVSKDYTVASVGGHKITTQALGLEISRELVRIRLQSGRDFSEKEVREAGLDRQVLRRMIVEMLLELEAKKLGITVSDDFAASFIKSSKIFQDEEGRFSKARFEQIVNHLGFRGERDYVPYVKAELLRSRFVKEVAPQLPVSKDYLNQLYAWSEQVRTLQVMIINPKEIKLIQEPSENDLREFYGKNQRAFIAPEKRTFNVLILDGKRFSSEISVQPSDVDALYEVNKNDKYKDIAPAEAKKQIKAELTREKQEEKVHEFAKQLESEYDSGTSLADLSKKHNLEFKQLKDRIQQEVKEEDEDAIFVAHAFTQEEGTLSPLEKGKGDQYFFTYLETVSPPKQLSFGDALSMVKGKFVETKQQEEAQELAKKVALELNQGGIFETTAAQYHLKIVSARVNRHDVLPPSQLAFLPIALRSIFNSPKGQAILVPHLTETKDLQLLVVRVTDIKNSDPSKAKDEDLTKFRDLIQVQMQGDMMDQFLDHLKNKYKVEINERFFKEPQQQDTGM